MKLSILSFLFFSILAFSSCEKNAFGDWDKRDSEEEKCFDFVYPITYIMPDGEKITGNNKEVLNTEMKAWYNTNDSKEKPTLQLPVNIIYVDGNTFTVKKEDDWIPAKADCEKDNCFEIVFPITYTMPDGSTITGNDKESISSDFKTWYTNNDSEEKPILQLPVNLLLGNGNTFTVNNDDDWITAKADCK